MAERKNILEFLSMYGITEQELEETGNKSLCDNHLTALLAYIENGCNASQAWRTAGYSDKGAFVESSRFFNRPNVKRLLQIAMISSTRHIKQTAHGIIVDRCMRVMRAHIFDYINPDGTLAFSERDEVDGSCIKSIESIPTRAGVRIKYTLHDPFEAANTLKAFIAIAEGYDLRAKVDTVDFKALDDDALRRIAAGKE